MFLHKVKELTHISQRMHEVIPPLYLQKPIHRRKWKMGANQRWNFCRNFTHFPLFFTLTKSTPPFWNSCPLSWKLNTMRKWNVYTWQNLKWQKIYIWKCDSFPLATRKMFAIWTPPVNVLFLMCIAYLLSNAKR